eukprot:gnl/Hemi2/13377_TR4593_c0_g1_i2.p1 gnl/Hemi2/13377_TR4593_c0_g1~~gnl/Hemi2/13377_TR4593_c0_g1_i2.p1  ORF type:complete len:676 (-),score=243.75 gnl/Hemi2/13377_TR4593_c0_g1_i2:85-2112(-)
MKLLGIAILAVAVVVLLQEGANAAFGFERETSGGKDKDMVERGLPEVELVPVGKKKSKLNAHATTFVPTKKVRNHKSQLRRGAEVFKPRELSQPFKLRRTAKVFEPSAKHQNEAPLPPLTRKTCPAHCASLLGPTPLPDRQRLANQPARDRRFLLIRKDFASFSYCDGGRMEMYHPAVLQHAGNALSGNAVAKEREERAHLTAFNNLRKNVLHEFALSPETLSVVKAAYSLLEHQKKQEIWIPYNPNQVKEDGCFSDHTNNNLRAQYCMIQCKLLVAFDNLEDKTAAPAVIVGRHIEDLGNPGAHPELIVGQVAADEKLALVVDDSENDDVLGLLQPLVGEVTEMPLAVVQEEEESSAAAAVQQQKKEEAEKALLLAGKGDDNEEEEDDDEEEDDPELLGEEDSALLRGPLVNEDELLGEEDSEESAFRMMRGLWGGDEGEDEEEDADDEREDEEREKATKKKLSEDEELSAGPVVQEVHHQEESVSLAPSHLKDDGHQRLEALKQPEPAKIEEAEKLRTKKGHSSPTSSLFDSLAVGCIVDLSAEYRSCGACSPDECEAHGCRWYEGGGHDDVDDPEGCLPIDLGDDSYWTDPTMLSTMPDAFSHHASKQGHRAFRGMDYDYNSFLPGPRAAATQTDPSEFTDASGNTHCCLGQFMCFLATCAAVGFTVARVLS